MDESDFLEKARETQMLLPMIAKIWHQAMQQHLNDHGAGLSGLQFGLLRMVHMEPLTSSELSKKFQLDPSTLVPTVNTLEQRGLIIRTRDSSDRRRQPLCLTESGLELINSIPFPVEDNDLIRSMRTMGAEKTAQLHALLLELISNVPNGDTMLAEVQERIALYHRSHAEKSKPSIDQV